MNLNIFRGKGNVKDKMTLLCVSVDVLMKKAKEESGAYHTYYMQTQQTKHT